MYKCQNICPLKFNSDLSVENFLYLFILESSFADNDIFNSSSGAKLLFMHCVILVDFLTFVFWKVI